MESKKNVSGNHKLDSTTNKKKKSKPRKGGLQGKLLAVEPEYRFVVYKKLLIEKANKKASSKKRSPLLQGSFENGKRR